MAEYSNIDEQICDVQNALVETGYFERSVFQDRDDSPAVRGSRVPGLERALAAAQEAQAEMLTVSSQIHEQVVSRILEIQGTISDPAEFDRLARLLEKILVGMNSFKTEPGFVKVYGELLSVYILILYRCGSPGRESPITRMILTGLARRKAVELNPANITESLKNIKDRVTIAIVAKRYAVYLLATRGLEVLFRSEISFRSFGASPADLALQIVNILVQQGIRLPEVTELVCAGGDLGTIPGGMYVLDNTVLKESRSRLGNSSLNRGALVGHELREILRNQGGQESIRLSLADPLSFSTLDDQSMSHFLRSDSPELSESLRGYVKATPLKSIAALIAEILRIRYDDLNLLVITLDELFASVVRKIGPRIIREMAAQEANATLNRIDFDKIRDALEEDGFQVPDHFRLASGEIGTGVKEICELMTIIESGRISSTLAQRLGQVVDIYASRVARVLEMASAGAEHERPQFVVVTSMMALDPYFHQIFAKIRNRIDNPSTPIMCLDSLEHEYLIARHLFELHINPAGDKRLNFSVEARSLRGALQVLRSRHGKEAAFSFSALLHKVTTSMSDGKLNPGSICLVGADNEDALLAVLEAKEYGIIKRLALIGDHRDIMETAERNEIVLRPDQDDDLQILRTDPLAVDHESKKESMAKVFGIFLRDNPHYLIMKGSLGTAAVLHQALSIYGSKLEPGDSQPAGTRRMASHTALFVLPDGRFFALSDAAVNPEFKTARDLLRAIENQIDVLRAVVDPELTLKVAVITAVETQTSAIPDTYLAAEAVERATNLEERYGPLVVEGPLSFDLATVPEVAEEKHYEGRIRGDANCLVATDINTANVIYKMLSKTMGSLGLMITNGSIITAGPGSVPIVLTSRGDTAQTKFNSILLAFAYSSRLH